MTQLTGSIKTPPQRVVVSNDIVLVPIFEVDAVTIYNCIEDTRSNLITYFSGWDLNFEDVEAYLVKLRLQWGISGEHAYAIIEHRSFVGVLNLLEAVLKIRRMVKRT